MAVPAKAVAASAAILLVLVVAIDIALERTYHIDLHEDGSWRTIGSYPFEERYSSGGDETLTVDGNETYTFRLRIDQTYPWAWSGDYVVRLNGLVVAEGRAEVPASGSTTVTFEAEGRAMLGFLGPPAPEYVAAKRIPRGSAEFQVAIDGDTFGIYIQVVEVRA